MAVIIERGKEPRRVNKGDGVAAPAGGVAVGGNVEGVVVIGNNKVVETRPNKKSQDLAELADELDNATYKKTAENFTIDELEKILQKLELIKDRYPTIYQDSMKRLGYKVEDVDDEVSSTGTGAVAIGPGKVAAGKGGIARQGNVGSITRNPNGTWTVED